MHILAKQQSNKIKSELHSAKENFDHKYAKRNRPTKDNLSKYILYGNLGKGRYGTVVYARQKNRKTFCAIKIMKKTLIMKNHTSVSMVLREKKILSSIDFKFVCQYISHFKDNANLFLVMEFHPIDLREYLYSKGPLKEDECKFYAAQIVCGLEYLHTIGVVHRDIKLDNILLSKDGYIRIADFGLAKKIDRGRTFTFFAPPVYYMPPEMVKHQPHGYEVDWYQLGILLYEMIFDTSPFHHTNEYKRFWNITEAEITFPSSSQEENANIIISLLKKKPELRLTNVERIKAHPYFKEMDWQKLFEKQIKPFVQPLGVPSGQDIKKNVYVEESSNELYPDEFKEF